MQAGPYGDALFEIDAGATYRFNPNLVFNLFGGFMIPDEGDEAWAAHVPDPVLVLRPAGSPTPQGGTPWGVFLSP